MLARESARTASNGVSHLVPITTAPPSDTTIQRLEEKMSMIDKTMQSFMVEQTKQHQVQQESTSVSVVDTTQNHMGVINKPPPVDVNVPLAGDCLFSPINSNNTNDNSETNFLRLLLTELLKKGGSTSDTSTTVGMEKNIKTSSRSPSRESKEHRKKVGSRALMILWQVGML